MKRLAVLAAAVLGTAVHAAEPDPPPVPQLAPTLPQIPRPILSGSDIRQGEAGRAEVTLPTAPARHHIRPTVKVEPGPDSVPGGLPPRGANGGAGISPTATLPIPATPTLPVPPVPDKPAPPPPADPQAPPAPGPGCGPNGCAAGHGGCWANVKAFLCYRQSKAYFGLHPTPYHPPFHIMFPCEEKAPCGPAGCAAGHGHGYAGGSVVGQSAAGGPGAASASGAGSEADGGASRARPSLGSRIGSKLFGRGDVVKPERGWATSGETIPGYRLAVPEPPAITGQRYPTPPVVGTSYKVPTGEK